MKLLKISAIAAILSLGTMSAQAEDVRVKGGSYIGTVNISLGGDPMPVENQTVIITATGVGTCNFALNNFSLIQNPKPEEILGDILVPNVKTTKEDGSDVIHFAGGIDGLILGPDDLPDENKIHANVTLDGVENADRTIDMNIHVMWLMDPTDPAAARPIEVTFKGTWDGHSGISDITLDDKATTPVYYNLDGTEATDVTVPGLYIVRRGNTVSKILVK